MVTKTKVTRPMTPAESKARHRLYMDFVKKSDMASKAKKAKRRLIDWDKAHGQPIRY